MSGPSFRDLTKTTELKVGTCFMEFDSPGIGHIAKAGGAEFAFVDMEHSGFDIATTKRIQRYMQAAGLQTLVRPPSKANHHIARVMDLGADALLLPLVETVEQASSIIKSMKYVPDGMRGVALSIAHDDYRPGPTLEKFAEANARVAAVMLIESRQGVDNAAAIAGIEGVDALWIGHNDLSCSLEIPGQFEHPEFLAAAQTVVAAARAHGRSAGRMAASVEEAVGLNRAGFDMICYSGDCFLLQAAIEGGISAIREACG